MGVGGEGAGRERRAFREFLERSNLFDVSLSGRKFTWYKYNGTCKSKLDRALINGFWADKWQDTLLRGLPRSISDHCAIILSTKEEDWGPRPFRFINAWMSHPEFTEVVDRSWRE